MAITANHKGVEFGVGDKVSVTQKIKEGEKERLQNFEGIVIGIKGRDVNKSFTVRRIGVQQIGIERIFPLFSPSLEKIEVTRKGSSGIRHAKLYYIRKKSKREIEKIYSRSQIKGKPIPQVKPKRSKAAKRKSPKKTGSKSPKK